MIKVLIADKINQRAVELLKEIPEFHILEKTGMNPAELKEEISGYEAVVVTNKTRLQADTLDRAEHLKIIVRSGVSLDNVDTDYTKTKNIEVKNTPFATSITVAEYTMALMLGICRSIGPAYKSMKDHKWENGFFSKGIDLHGKRAGIIGFGKIGKEVAKRELAMGMKVQFYDIADIKTDIDAKQVSLDELLSTADFISIHLPQTGAARDSISTAEFDKMKKDVVLIDVTLGGIINEAALLKALQENKIKAVAVDVYQDEPMNLELIDHEKVFPAPHLGTSTGLDVISILKDFFNV